MGININIRTIAGADHPDWDWQRRAGDRQFPTWFHQLETEDWTPKEFPWGDDLILYRPKDFSAFREAASHAEQPERWIKAAQILEENPDYWFYLSY